MGHGYDFSVIKRYKKTSWRNLDYVDKEKEEIEGFECCLREKYKKVRLGTVSFAPRQLTLEGYMHNRAIYFCLLQ